MKKPPATSGKSYVPNFTAVLAAAISSIIGGARPPNDNNNAPGSSPSGVTTSCGNHANNVTSSRSLFLETYRGQVHSLIISLFCF